MTCSKTSSYVLKNLNLCIHLMVSINQNLKFSLVIYIKLIVLLYKLGYLSIILDKLYNK